MGCACSGTIFMPPDNPCIPVNSTLLRTKDGNNIPIKYINLGYKFTLLVSHGNAEDIVKLEEWIITDFLHIVKANILLYEYSGYLDNSVSPSEKFVYSDCESALWFLTDCLRVPRQRIILYGRSLGSGPT